jgi:hypothetical protein
MSQADYDRYYVTQAGSGLPFYSGSAVQRGYGLGNVLGGLLRTAVPFLKPVVKSVGREVMRSGMDLVKDVVRGRNVKTAVKRRLGEGAKRSLVRVAEGVVNGSARRRAPPPPPPRKRIKRTRQRRGRVRPAKDIFG